MNPISLATVRSALANRRMLTSYGIATVVGIFAIGLYLPTLNFEFVNWDDPWYVLNNPLIQSWSLANLKTMATESVIRNYAPLTMFSLLLEYTLFGDWAGGYHLVNLILHAVNAALVFFLIRQVTARTSVAVVTAVFFAAHPVHVESVAWVSSFKGLLSASFILCSLLCWLREERTPKQELWGIGFLILALLSKAIAVVVPAVVLAYDMGVRKQRFSEAVARQVIPGFLAIWLLLATMSAQVTMLGGVRGHYALSRIETIAVDLVILWHYVGMLLCPQELCVLYDPATSGIGLQILFAACAWGAASWWLWTRRQQSPLVFFAAICWLAFLIPVLNLFPITTLMNDRYLYLPSIPFLAVLAGALLMLVETLGKITTQRFAQVVGTIVVCLVTLGFIQRTRNYLPVWENDLALWEHAAEHSPLLTTVQFQRAISLENAGETQAAIAALEFAMTNCQPDELDRKRIQEKQTLWANSEETLTSDER